MPPSLQWALFSASLAIIVLAACLIPLAILACRRLSGLARAGEEIKERLELLLQDSRELIQNVTVLSRRAQSQMDDVDIVMRTARAWTVRADRLVDGVGSVIEPPVFSLVSLSNLIRTGAGAFIQSLFHKNRAALADQPQHQKEENEHV